VTSHKAFGEICSQVCREQGWELLPSGVRVDCDEGRHQLVALELFESSDEELVRLSTTIGAVAELGAMRLATALRINYDLAHGALAIRDDQLVMIETLPLEDAGSAQIEASIRYLAQTADRYERSLFDIDEN
jgi:hypothetical protein